MVYKNGWREDGMFKSCFLLLFSFFVFLLVVCSIGQGFISQDLHNQQVLYFLVPGRCRPDNNAICS